LQAASQSRVSQASVPVHVTMQREPLLQSMLAQAFAPVQLMVHVQPDGQLTEPHVSVLVHSTRHVFASSSHIVQSDGQFGMTQ